MNPDSDERPRPARDSLLWSIDLALRRVREQLAMHALDADGSLAQAAAVLRQKRGCRR